MLTYRTAGESHGKGILALVDGYPAGAVIDIERIDHELRRRQGGYGRGGRQAIETDRAEVLTGIWQGRSIGSPIALWVVNRDYRLETLEDLSRPRPGHGDLSGSIKYLGSIRGILERASARETAGRVAAGALASGLLAQLDIRVVGYVVSIGEIEVSPIDAPYEELVERRDRSELYTLRPEDDQALKDRIDRCREEGDTLGGVVEVRVEGVPFGLGTHAQWDQKLDGRLARAAMAVQAIKGVEIGAGFEAAKLPGSEVHDAIQFDAAKREESTLGYVRPTNRAGGLEAGMTNGQPIIVRAAMKPIATLRKALESIDRETKEPQEASYERSDVCAVSATSVVMENIVAFEIATALIEKFGGDSLEEIAARIKLFNQMAIDANK